MTLSEVLRQPPCASPRLFARPLALKLEMTSLAPIAGLGLLGSNPT